MEFILVIFLIILAIVIPSCRRQNKPVPWLILIIVFAGVLVLFWYSGYSTKQNSIKNSDLYKKYNSGTKTYVANTPTVTSTATPMLTVTSTATPMPTDTPVPTKKTTPMPTKKTTPVPTKKTTPKPEKDDPYNAKDYVDPDDFYYDNYDDFWDFEDAEDYWEENQ